MTEPDLKEIQKIFPGATSDDYRSYLNRWHTSLSRQIKKNPSNEFLKQLLIKVEGKITKELYKEKKGT